MAAVPVSNRFESLYVQEVEGTRNTLVLPITLIGKNRSKDTQALIDSGAYSMFINKKFVSENRIKTKKLEQPIWVYNADRTRNKRGAIDQYAWLRLRIGDHTSWSPFLVADIGERDVIIGLDFLRIHNPTVNWESGTLEFDRCPESCGEKFRKKAERRADSVVTLAEGVPIRQVRRRKPTHVQRTPEVKATLKISREETVELREEADVDFEDEIPMGYRFNPNFEEQHRNTTDYFMLDLDRPDCNQVVNQFLEICAKYTPAQDLAAKKDAKEDKKPWTEIVPNYLHGFESTFSKRASERLPLRKEYDHPIDLTVPDDKLPRPTKIYPLSPVEQKALDEFLEENLRKGYIRPCHKSLFSLYIVLLFLLPFHSLERVLPSYNAFSVPFHTHTRPFHYFLPSHKHTGPKHCSYATPRCIHLSLA